MDGNLIAEAFRLIVQAFDLVAVAGHQLVEGGVRQPEIALVDKEHEGFEVTLGVGFFLDHIHDVVEGVFVLKHIGMVDEEDDAARLGFAEEVEPVGLPHFVLTTDIAGGLEAHGFVTDVGRERADRIATGGGWSGLEFFEGADVEAQPFDEGGFTRLARAENDEWQPENLDVDEVVEAVGAVGERIDDFAIADSAEDGAEELVDQVGHGKPFRKQ